MREVQLAEAADPTCSSTRQPEPDRSASGRHGQRCPPHRRHRRAAARAASAADRPQPGPAAAPARQAWPSRAAAAAGDPCRRHQRQGQHLRLPARHGEAAGLRVHVYTSPHLVRFNERIRIAGELVSDDALADALEEVERVNAGAPITVFEVITAVAFHLFAQTPADLCVLEVGLGGRGDATNVIAQPAACAITSISLDHRELLGDTLELIAAEKAGIMKPGVPVAIGAQPAAVLAGAAGSGRARRRAGAAARPRLARRAARATACAMPMRTARSTCRRRRCPVRSSSTMPASPSPRCVRRAWRAGCRDRRAASPPRNGRRGCSACTAGSPRLLPPDWELWLDGGHNPGAGVVLARASALLGGPAGASDRRHEDRRRTRRSSCARCCRSRRRSGRWRSRGSTSRCRSRRSSRPPAASRGPGRTSPTRCARCHASTRPGARADLRQSVSGGRGAEAQRIACRPLSRLGVSCHHPPYSAMDAGYRACSGD